MKNILHRNTIRIFLVLTFSIFFSGMAERNRESSRVYQFPENFLWGAATSAYQVEGGIENNDWIEWERLGKTKHFSGKAADYYHRFHSDHKLAKNLGINAFRLSIEWSRIEPEKGIFDEREIKHYRDVLISAKKNGLKVFVTLHHFTNPVWVANRGGWLHPEMPEWLAGYSRRIALEMGQYVDYWITVNEPNVNAVTSYLAGLTPPGEQDVTKAVQVLANYLKAHAQMYRAIHRVLPYTNVGFSHHMRVFEAEHWWNPADRFTASILDAFWNLQPLQALKTGEIRFSIPFLIRYEESVPELVDTLDFIGVNYYSRDMVAFDLSSPQKFRLSTKANSEKSEMGWEIYPQGLYQVLLQAGSFGLPVYITENGLADARDVLRKKFLCDHLREVQHAIEDGVDLRGYLHWAFLDNFEWLDGFDPRFGLVEVDYQTFERKPRGSAWLYSDIIRSRSLYICGF